MASYRSCQSSIVLSYQFCTHGLQTLGSTWTHQLCTHIPNLIVGQLQMRQVMRHSQTLRNELQRHTRERECFVCFLFTARRSKKKGQCKARPLRSSSVLPMARLSLQESQPGTAALGGEGQLVSPLVWPQCQLSLCSLVG